MLSSYFRKLIEKLYQKAKNEPDYEIPKWLPEGVLIHEMVVRGQMLLRGILYKPRFKELKGLLFIGKNVRFREPSNIILGRSISIHDNAYIDGLCKETIVIGNNFTLREYSIIECTGVIRFPGEGLIIGDDVGISQHAFIGARGKIQIGNNVIMGPYATIYAANHNFSDIHNLINNQGESRKGIIIEDDCWLGTGCKILDAVTIGKGSVIAAGCVVTKSIPPYSIVAGVPGRVLRMRGEI